MASGRGPEYVNRCPFQIGIVSTGLIFHDSGERAALLGGRYGTVVLDEAHRARRRGALGETGRVEYNNLLAFMSSIGERAENVLLGTATPIQTEIYELWDLGTGAETMKVYATVCVGCSDTRNQTQETRNQTASIRSTPRRRQANKGQSTQSSSPAHSHDSA